MTQLVSSAPGQLIRRDKLANLAGRERVERFPGGCTSSPGITDRHYRRDTGHIGPRQDVHNGDHRQQRRRQVRRPAIYPHCALTSGSLNRLAAGMAVAAPPRLMRGSDQRGVRRAWRRSQR